MNIAWVNGKWKPIASAFVSVEDRGFQFGDGVYELIRTYRGEPFHLQDHLTRLIGSAKQIEIFPTLTREQLTHVILAGCKKNGHANLKIYIQITRGQAPRLHTYPKTGRPTWVMTFRNFVPLSQTIRTQGVAVLTIPDVRWGHCNIKSINLLANVMAREQAARQGHFEALFIREGNVTEGAGSNVFAVFGGEIMTPAESPAVLSGITREVVLKLGKKLGFQMTAGNISLSHLKQADEIFLTGTTIEVLPVVRLNKKTIGSGQPGPLTQALVEAFQRHLKVSIHPSSQRGANA